MSTLTISTGPARRIGFISTRFCGTDGVTLEARKWAQILAEQGHCCFWMAGQLDVPDGTGYLSEILFFHHPEIREIQSWLFGTTIRPRAISNQVQTIKEQIKAEIYRFIEKFRVEVLIPENILAIPMHVPLGLAMTEVIVETGLPVIAHHHDFSWERERFVHNACADYLQAAFPPVVPRIEHVVINSMAQHELARRFGLPSTIIPNILDFETPAPPIDAYSADLRQELGFQADDILVLQPTRVVARKGIEHSIELVRRLRHPKAKLVFSHSSGDEGNDYEQLVREHVADAGIEARFLSNRIGEFRGRTADDKKIYTLFDIYAHADLVTYPSHYEGFGNAFLEAIYFRKPVVVNRYAVYAKDIGPLGFKNIQISQVISNQVIEQVKGIIDSKSLREEWGEINYNLGLKYFSYAVARRKLTARLLNLFGEGF
jgi:glycosyltransferase involved in cell wall biosynthesis